MINFDKNTCFALLWMTSKFTFIVSFPYTDRYVRTHIYLHESIHKNAFVSTSKTSTPTYVKTYVDVVSEYT